LSGNRPVALARPSGYSPITERFTASHRWLLKITVRIGRAWARSTKWQDSGWVEKDAPAPRGAITVESGQGSLSAGARPEPPPRPLECGEAKYVPGRVNAA